MKMILYYTKLHTSSLPELFVGMFLSVCDWDVFVLVSNLRGSDSGYYRCTLNFNKKALHVEHKLLVEGMKL